jgi:DNA-binding XRE family transcriptional regulator
MPTKNFKDLADGVRADPKRAARVDSYKRAMSTAIALADLRESLGMTQGRLAGELGVSQANVSRIEHQEDMFLSTLAEYIAAMGGSLKLLALFPEREVEIEVPTVRRPVAASR